MAEANRCMMGLLRAGKRGRHIAGSFLISGLWWVDGGVVEIWLKGKEYYLLYNIGKYVKLWERDKFGLMPGKP